MWVVNVFLLLAYLFNPSIYQSLVDGGAKMFVCVQLTDHGYVASNACTDPVPVLNMEGGH